ncbi:helix-turn-helix domain-containing protein [Psychrobacter pasteurii]|nr:helix-turn-helix domain-containing protein [Psychrobacter pasteurii]
MIRGHIIELNPNNKQATYFTKACGIARLAYNWALSSVATTVCSR